MHVLSSAKWQSAREDVQSWVWCGNVGKEKKKTWEILHRRSGINS